MSLDVCTEYTTTMAVEDFAAVVLAGIGAYLLARLAGRAYAVAGRVAMAGAVLLILGGAAKATWKLFVSLDPCRQYDLLQQALFPLLGAGLLALSWALLVVVRDRLVVWWPFLVAYAVAVGGAVAVGSGMPLIAIVAIGAVVVGGCGITLASGRGDTIAVALFIVYLIGSLVLPPLAAKSQTGAVQWVEQGANTVTQAAFALAAWRVLRSTRTPARTSLHQEVPV